MFIPVFRYDDKITLVFYGMTMVLHSKTICSVHRIRCVGNWHTAVASISFHCDCSGRSIRYTLASSEKCRVYTGLGVKILYNYFCRVDTVLGSVFGCVYSGLSIRYTSASSKKYRFGKCSSAPSYIFVSNGLLLVYTGLGVKKCRTYLCRMAVASVIFRFSTTR